MDTEFTSDSGLILPVPNEGLFETLRSWSGKGQLWSALAAVSDDKFVERQWSERDIKRRAHRVLFARIVPQIKKWPVNIQIWVESLPAEMFRYRITTSTPVSGTLWRETRRLGWPPSSFVANSRNRIADTLLVTVLRWTFDKLLEIRDDAVSVEPNVDIDVRHQLKVVEKLLEEEPLISTSGVVPSRADVAAMRAEGRPWNMVSPVSDDLRRLTEGSVFEIAQALIRPSEDLNWRLFHLAVLGSILISLKNLRAKITSVRPLSSAANGPSYIIRDSLGRDWDLWFEAAGVWKHYRKKSLYTIVSEGVTGNERPIGADLMLILPDQQVLIVECKYSSSREVVGRHGYQQALAYAVEARSELAMNITTIVVGPENVISFPKFIETVVGKVGIVPPSALPGIISSILL